MGSYFSRSKTMARIVWLKMKISAPMAIVPGNLRYMGSFFTLETDVLLAFARYSRAARSVVRLGV